MKKIISLILVFIFSISMISVVSAKQPDDDALIPSNQISTRFDDNNYNNMSILEKGKAKLLESGHTKICISNMPSATIEKIALATSFEQTISYYTEDSNGDLKKINKEEFDAINIEIPQVDTESIDIITQSVQDSPGLSDIKASSATSDIDGGTVRIVTTMYSVVSSNPSHYLVVSSFQWTKMPRYRGRDIFGITRDSNTVYIPGTFGNFTYYQTVNRNWFASAANSHILLNESLTSTQNNNLSNSDSSATAFAIRYSLPVDFIPHSVLVGSFYNTTQHYDLQGAVWYEGRLKQPSIQPTSFNHWSTYLHQNSTIWFSNPTISYPWGASITISPTSNYSPPVVDVILNTWWNNTLYNG